MNNLSSSDLKILDTILSKFPNYTAFNVYDIINKYIGHGINPYKEDLGKIKELFHYPSTIDNLNAFLTQNGFATFIDTEIAIELTDKGRLLKKSGSLDKFLKSEQKKERFEWFKIFKEKATFWISVVGLTIAILTFFRTCNNNNLNDNKRMTEQKQQ